MVPTSSQWDDFPPRAQNEILSIESELDTLWPGWRQKLRFDKVEYDLKFKLKGLLKKHMLLTRREGGHPAPRYWDVLVVRDGQDKTKCYAHPIMPKGHEEGNERFSERAPVAGGYKRPLEARPCEGLPTLAFRLRTPLEALETLSRASPDGLVDERALEEWLEAQILSFRQPSIVTPKVSE